MGINIKLVLGEFSCLLLVIAQTSFADSGSPIVSADEATSVTSPAATLNGQVNPNGADTFGWFQWGFTTNYGLVTLPQSIGNDSNAIPLSQVITGLDAGVTYHFRIVASNAFGTAQGDDRTFTAPSAAPSVSTQAAIGITANNATLVGNVSENGLPTSAWFEWGDSTNLGNVIGLTGGGLAFDGVDDYVNVGTNKFSGITSPFTIEFWAYPMGVRAVTPESNSGITGTSNQQYAIFPERKTSTTPGAPVGIGVSVGINGVSVFEHGNNLLCSPLVFSTNLLGWTHIAVVYQNFRPYLYINGALVRTGLFGGLITPQPSSNLGESGYGYGPYQGYLDEVRVWKGAFTEADIQYWMHQYVDEADWSFSNLAGCWSMNEGAGTIAFDSSSRTNHGTLTNGPTWISQTPLGRQSLPLSGLLATNTYYYRIVASNSLGITYGSIMSFTTTNGRPGVLAVGFTNVTATSALLTGTVLPNGATTSAQFLYNGPGTGTIVSPSQSFDGNGTNNVAILLTNLSPSTAYSIMLVAINSLGASNSPNRTFQTLVLPPTISGTSLSTNGQFRLLFNGYTNASYTILASTNLMTWDEIGIATQSPPGQFQFIDNTSTNGAGRFYRLRSP